MSMFLFALLMLPLMAVATASRKGSAPTEDVAPEPIENVDAPPEFETASTKDEGDEPIPPPPEIPPTADEMASIASSRIEKPKGPLAEAVAKEIAKPTEAPTVVAHATDLLARAAYYGIEADEASGLDEIELTRRMVAIDKQIAKMQGARTSAPVEAPTTQPAQAPAPPQAEAPKPQPVVQTPTEFKRYEVPQDFKDAYSPEVAAQLEAVSNHYATQIEALTSRLASFDTAEQRRVQEYQQFRQRQIESLFDQAVEKLGPDYAELLGKGPTAKLDPNGPQLKARQQLYATSDGIAKTLQAISGTVPAIEFDEIVRRGLNGAYPDQVLQIAQRKLGEKVQSRQGAVVHRPAAATQNITDPRKKAIAAVQDIIAKAGGGPEDSAPDDFDE